MGSYLDIQDDPNEVSGTGAILRAIGTSFQGQARGILADINAVNAERPWGSGLDRAGEGLIRPADKTVLAMTEYQGVDAESRTKINQTNV
ncbi:hypothetical protein RB614_18730 [Phytohabitans sp. ZYX-F-186]|uniref:Uncharacterized protein n=1 Tax=Phytohabitans maris TaxID=3071409 RepID=A0ABU0ZHM0_9ACTN|nr:hypothetical protein [Phytohabitans sp. ZYX-F-186]MDQ7906554.1 hypothetical protein [Phytohabitans sp. ZYX-F-186]